MTQFPNVLCVGMHFRGPAARDVAAALTPGDTVLLEREPDNAFDAYAIRVLVPDGDEPPFHIGYIERGQAAWISPLIDDGATATAEVTGVEQRKNNLHPVLVIHVSE